MFVCSGGAVAAAAATYAGIFASTVLELNFSKFKIGVSMITLQSVYNIINIFCRLFPTAC
jgi:hypothetical protein